MFSSLLAKQWKKSGEGVGRKKFHAELMGDGVVEVF